MTIDQSVVQEFAGIMLSAYRAAAADARMFMREHGSPTTTMDKAHRFRSLVQAGVVETDRYRLHSDYVEFGRVGITDRVTHVSMVIRSRSAMSVEKAINSESQYGLFPEPARADGGKPYLLGYSFDRNGLRMWFCTTRKVGKADRLAPAAPMEYIGFWPFESSGPPSGGGPGGSQFDQGAEDPFDDLGNPDIGEAGEL